MKRVIAKLRLIVAPVVVLSAACNVANPVSPTAIPRGDVVTINGTVIATNGGQPLPGISLITPLETVASNPSGGVEFSLSGARGSFPFTISGPSIITRTTTLGAATQPVALDVFLQDGSFDLAFYRAFARNGYEQPSHLQPLRRWQQAPQVYLKTTDEAGQPVDAVTLNTTEAALADTVRIWTGEHFGLAGVTRGTGTREGTPNWITVKWANPPVPGRCGLSTTVGADGGSIELNYLGPCACGGASRIYPRLVRHELGHALGYYHTDSPNDVMYGKQIAANACDLQPSARERQYAKYVYSRPSGNTDPDNDPPTAR